MLIINPGSTHFDALTGLATLNFADYITPGAAVATIGNNPAKVTSN